MSNEETKKFEIEIPQICKTCGGKCCKTFSGPATPRDFGQSKEEIRKNLYKALKSSRWTIDWISQENELYFVRPTVKGFEGSVFDHRYSGECTFLTETGCELTFKERPESCRMLIPKSNEKCDPQGYTRMYVAKLWQEYLDVLLDVAIDVENEGI
jgi:Fe-S-cluster containining protein